MIDNLLVPLASGTRHRMMRGLLIVLMFLTAQLATAQDASRALRGVWEVEIPEKGKLVLIFKGQGLASYFWADIPDQTVYQGSWTVQADRSAEAIWPDGGKILLGKAETGFAATITSGQVGEPFTVEAKPVSQDTLGQWAKPPERENGLQADSEEGEGFFGIWMIGESPTEYVFVEPDRSVASTLGDSERGQRGQWARQGSELHLIWDSGDYSILSVTERGFAYKQVVKGTVIEEDETTPVSAIRTSESNVPEDWLRRYQEERQLLAGGIAFTTRKEARAFYRGNWIIQRGDGTFDRIEIKRFGGLETSADRSLGGQWRQSGQDIFMRWDDGIRKILSPVGQGFVLYEYRPGRPLDGVPSRVFASAPEHSGKFEKYLAGRTAVAEQMQRMAQTAGISESARRSGGWGRSFARWVWPFGADDSQSADDLISEEFDPESEDPWWWPFWSEKTDDQIESDEAGAVESPESAGEAPVVTEEVESPTEEKTKKKSKSWQWPF